MVWACDETRGNKCSKSCYENELEEKKGRGRPKKKN
jgi:hypothetical protein